ncbi:MAG: GAP family protein [Prochlorococcus sp.]|nr:GAP family protein [Prochlorococcaceae cyanobacterium Fu_MAG_50]
MTDASLWAELLAYGTGLGLSPIHIGVLLLLLLGPNPIKRGAWFVAGWIATTMIVVILLLTVGHNLVLDMTHGSQHRTGLDLLAGGALIALGAKELLRVFADGDEEPAWTKTVDRFVSLPLPLLIGIGALTELASPDDVFLFAKSAALVLSANLQPTQELISTAAFTFGSSLLLLTPLLAVIIGKDSVLPILQKGKQILFARGELVVGGISLALGAYIGWQGISGLTLA